MKATQTTNIDTWEIQNQAFKILQSKGYNFEDKKYKSGKALCPIYDAITATIEALTKSNNPSV